MKIKNPKKIAFLFLMMCVASTVHAQSCPRPYLPREADTVKLIFSDTVSPLLSRIAQISYLCGADEPIVSLGLMTQRQAFEAEYQALVQYLNSIPTSSLTNGLSTRSKRFIASIVNSSNLGLSGTTLSGSTQEEALTNSRAVNDASNSALSDLWRCY